MSSRRSGNRARCQFEGCEKFAQTRGLCKAHGGGSRCRDPNCNKLAQSRGLCIAHGGGRRCQSEGCLKLAQSKGFCISHGGGRRCTVPNCEKFSQVKGRCKSHSKLPDVAFAAVNPQFKDNSVVRRVSSVGTAKEAAYSPVDTTKHSISFLVNPLGRSFSAGSIDFPKSEPIPITTSPTLGRRPMLPSIRRNCSNESLHSLSSVSSYHSDFGRFPPSPNNAVVSPSLLERHSLPLDPQKYVADLPLPAFSGRFSLSPMEGSMRLMGVPLTSFLAHPQDLKPESTLPVSTTSPQARFVSPTSPSVVLPSLAQLHMR